MKFMAVYSMFFVALELGVDATRQEQQWLVIVNAFAALCWIIGGVLLAAKYEVVEK